MSQVGEIYQVFRPSRRTAVSLSLVALASAMMGGVARACPAKDVGSTKGRITQLDVNVVGGGLIAVGALYYAPAAGVLTATVAAGALAVVVIAVVLYLGARATGLDKIFTTFFSL